VLGVVEQEQHLFAVQHLGRYLVEWPVGLLDHAVAGPPARVGTWCGTCRSSHPSGRHSSSGSRERDHRQQRWPEPPGGRDCRTGTSSCLLLLGCRLLRRRLDAVCHRKPRGRLPLPPDEPGELRRPTCRGRRRPGPRRGAGPGPPVLSEDRPSSARPRCRDAALLAPVCANDHGQSRRSRRDGPYLSRASRRRGQFRRAAAMPPIDSSATTSTITVHHAIATTGTRCAAPFCSSSQWATRVMAAGAPVCGNVARRLGRVLATAASRMGRRVRAGRGCADSRRGCEGANQAVVECPTRHGRGRTVFEPESSRPAGGRRASARCAPPTGRDSSCFR
jgi:hypothetical protein